MIIREYRETDCKELIRLFYDTVHEINAADYTKEQLDAWAPKQISTANWNSSLMKNYSLVAEKQGTIIGFGDIEQTGYLNRLFVHKKYQRRGTAAAICHRLEQAVQCKITVRSSITAKPFFEKRGYRVIETRYTEREGIALLSFIMEKPFQPLIL